MGVPPDMEVAFASVQDAAGTVDDWVASDVRTVLLLADVDTLARLCRATSTIRDVNLGGIHHRNGRTERLPYVFLTDAEVHTLEELRTRGIAVTAQDVPTARPVPLTELQ